MRIIAVDPGYERLGIAVLDKKEREELLFSECFKTSKILPFPERLELVGREIERIIQKFSPTELAIENLFIDNNQKTAMRVSETRGAILYQARLSGLSITEYTPLQIKLAVAGYGKATKPQMMSMVRKLIAGTENKFQDDEMDAIATGITHFAHTRSRK